MTVNYSWNVVAYEELEYDPNGNLVQDGSFYYEYDGWQRLRRVRENDSSGRLLAEYAYDPAGQRIKKVVYFADDSNETTIYIGDFVRVINATGTYDTKYVRDDKGTLLAVIDPQNKTFYYHPDHLGSTRLVTNDSGEVVEKTDYMPFGAAINGGNDRYTYTGQEKDPETELMYYGARYYSPYMHRFTQPDTIIPNVYDPQSLNRYAYVKNNPLKYVDPSGHLELVPLVLIGFTILIVANTAMWVRGQFAASRLEQMTKEQEVRFNAINDKNIEYLIQNSNVPEEDTIDVLKNGPSDSQYKKGFDDILRFMKPEDPVYKEMEYRINEIRKKCGGDADCTDAAKKVVKDKDFDKKMSEIVKVKQGNEAGEAAKETAEALQAALDKPDHTPLKDAQINNPPT